MPIKIRSDLPAREILEKENIFVMDEYRAMHQDVRPIEIGILNLMPLKEDNELQMLRSLSNTPLQVNVTFLAVKNHVSKNTSQKHLDKFYETFDDIKDKNLDGLIITGAPVEDIAFEEVDYWEEVKEYMDWAQEHVTSTIHLCWGAQAALYHYYGISKRQMPKKVFGVFEHKVLNRKIPLVRGFDDHFMAPHSRHTESPLSEIEKIEDLTVLAVSDEAGFFLAIDKTGKHIFIMGHPEYDRMTLDKEYRRDKDKGLDIDVPVNYYPDDDPEQKPLLQWRSHGNILYSNWLNYYVYQQTPYDFIYTDSIYGK
ncbi:MAG: homoserine O-succinyltransferase [Lachnospiraceae bacterium]|nr:homoserine O-succinyltransferase [Lachnospiraceae bacterium]